MFDVCEKSLRELQTAMENKETTSEELVLAYMERIARLDPQLHSVLEINPDALFIARSLDRERTNGKGRGPLHGIPLLVKDNISTADRLHTSAGAESLKDNFSLRDAKVIEYLRNAGAVILGKANLSEFARYMATEIPNGYSARGGQCKNPYGEELDPLGSSTGSAVAAAMSFCAAAVGTETSGSIISPSSANGIVGLKPTIGAVSRSGIIPINSQDTAGPMGRSVEDVALLCAGMVGPDPEDPATLATEEVVPGEYWPYLKKDALKGKRVGISRKARPWYSAEQLAVYEAALPYLEKAGATLVEDCDLPDVFPPSGFLSDMVLRYEFKCYMDHWLAKYCSLADIRTLQDIVDYNNAHKETAIRYGQDILEDCAKTSGTMTEPDYLKEKIRLLAACSHGIDDLLKEKDLDVLVCPGPTALAPTCGYPILNVPAGIAADGRPMGISFVGTAFSDGELLSYGYAFEQASKLRKEPELSRK